MARKSAHGKEKRTGTLRAQTRAVLLDVAKLAGVGIATVDRALNERGNVSPDTARKVIEAARQLGLRRTLPLLYRKGIRIDVILPRPDLPSSARLSDAFLAIARRIDPSIIIQRRFVDESKPAAVAEQILESKGNALVVYVSEVAVIVDAVATVTAAGKPVVTLVSDLPTSPRLAYVGIDHYAAGRTAAYFIAKMISEDGYAAILTHSLEYRSHALRVSGFRDWMADHKPGLRIAGILEGREDARLSFELLWDLIRRHPNIAAIYNTGDANSSVERLLSEIGQSRKAIFVGHELTDQTARLLKENAMTLAIDQNPEAQARAAVDVLLHRFGYVLQPENSERVSFSLYGPENLQN